MAGNDGKDTLSCKLVSSELRKLFAASGDVIARDITIRNRADLGVVLMYVDGMVNQKIINDNVLRPLSASKWFDNCPNLSHAYQLCIRGALDVALVKPADCADEAVESMLAGKTLLMFDSLERALILDTIGFEKRGIMISSEEEVFRSGKDSFVETLRVNTAILRRRIRSRHLAIEETVVGRQTRTRVCVAYMGNICNDEFVSRVRSAIGRIDQDKALSIRDIYEHVVQAKYTPFPVATVTEKPDACCMSLLEGKVAVIVDELPYAILFPGVFGDIFQSASDYGFNPFTASLFRLIRYLCFAITIFLPGFYVSVVTFHIKMIPYQLAISIEASRIGVPFRVSIEAIAMTLAFFVLIQASMQISRTIGSAISIVGGLVLGEAAITAGLVSPAVIVIVATASISSLAIPSKEAHMALWVYQLVNTLLSTVLGLFGLVVGTLFILFTLARLETLGIPYMAPYIVNKKLQLDDSLIRFPMGWMKNRPAYLKPKNLRRRR
jgi:spore germination protein KA